MKYLLIAAALSLGLSGTCLAATLHADHHVHGSVLAKAQAGRHVSNPMANSDRAQNEKGG